MIVGVAVIVIAFEVQGLLRWEQAEKGDRSHNIYDKATVVICTLQMAEPSHSLNCE